MNRHRQPPKTSESKRLKTGKAAAEDLEVAAVMDLSPDATQKAMNANPELTYDLIQRQQDDYKKRMEQLQTDKFVEGLRKAVRRHIAEREASGTQSSLPRTPPPPLPHYAYNNTTKELARLHAQPDYHETFPASTLDQSPHHMMGNLTHHAISYQETYLSKLTIARNEELPD